MLVSLVASFVMLLLVNIITVKSLLALRPLGVWMTSSFVFSFIFIWAIRTYRIIIRHMTIRALGRFVMVAFCKTMMTGFVFGMIFTFSKLLYVMMMADFFITSAAFFLLRFCMLVVYDLVKDRLAERKNCENVLIYGIGDKSVSLINRLQNSPHYRIVGFVQYGKTTVSHVISEVNVY
jgi:FlaA1/EpsC-like NDP-sugar epimerase